jgi:hypothetical protein
VRFWDSTERGKREMREVRERETWKEEGERERERESKERKPKETIERPKRQTHRESERKS